MSQNHPGHLKREDETGQHYKGKEKQQSRNPTPLTALLKRTECPVNVPEATETQMLYCGPAGSSAHLRPHTARDTSRCCFHMHFLETLIHLKKTMRSFFPWWSGPLGHGGQKRWPTHKRRLLLPARRSDRGLRKDCRWRGTAKEPRKRHASFVRGCSGSTITLLDILL